MTIPGWPVVFRGAAAVAGPDAVLGGYSSAELLGRSCAPWRAPAQVVGAQLRSGARSRAGVIVRRDTLHPGEIDQVDGVRITSRLRTAFDLARLLPPTEAIVSVPRPVAQHPVVDDRRILWLDLACPEQRLGVEYDGGDHFATALGTARRDAAQRAGTITGAR